MVRGVRTPPQSRIHPIALLENEAAIQASIMEVVNALVRNTVDNKRAELILRALNAAIRNSRRVRFDADQNHMVKQIPDYPAPPKPERVAAAAATVPAKSAATTKPADAYNFAGIFGGKEAPAESEKPVAQGLADPSQFSKAGPQHNFPQRKPPANMKGEAPGQRKNAVAP